MAQQSQTMTAKSITQDVEKSVKDELSLLASQQQWGEFEATLVTLVPDSVKHLERCLQPLSITGRDNHYFPVGHLKRSVTCQDGQNDWRINTTVRVTLSLPVVVAAKTLNRHDNITFKDVKLEQRSITRDMPFIVRLDQVIGKNVNRRLRSGQLINARFISTPPLVEKGNEVIMVATSGKFSASTRGLAMETGGKGEQIRVQNLKSKKIIRAVVTGLNQVQTQF
ncbi:flagellar basal body P-ring formation chaperone FlgA [Vibrio sp. 10N.286.49.B1]|uniref:flagellar basal body P-ring formation chaperone FlgA n=1 Tax=unclassified Vibrio TaxID=2614977 RepID=UPI001F539B59|nr:MULTISPECIES: flagellar basal body P-ring formation chaperone FlgA [unclassified Vibrio]